MIEIHERDTATMASIRGEATDAAQALLKDIQESGYRLGLLRGQQNITETLAQRNQLLQTVTELLQQNGRLEHLQDRDVILRAERLMQYLRDQDKHGAIDIAVVAAAVSAGQASAIERAVIDRSNLIAAITDVLEGQPIDEYGNRDENGLNRYPDLKWIAKRLREALGATS